MRADVPGATSVSQVRCPILVGRDNERGEIESALAGARGGDGRVVIVAGEAGIGKTRLTREAEKSARATAMRMLRGRATSTAVPIPYRPIIEALNSALRAEEDLSDPTLAPYRGVLRAFTPGSEGPGPDAHKLLMLEGVGRLLGSIGRRDGALLVLEDLHWADADTLGLIEYVAENLANDRVACLLTLRDEPGPAFELAEALAARRTALLLRLDRLPSSDVDRMTRAALGVETPPSDLLAALHDRAEGVPFVVEEMLTTYMASGGDARAPASLPHTFRELVRARLSGVDDRTRAVVLAAAVIGRTFDWALLSEVSGLSRKRVLTALREAVSAQLVVADPNSSFEMPFGFRHALVREGLVAELLPPELADLSARAADAAESRFPGLPGEWCERVAQLREAQGDRTAAARHLQEAAQRAVGRGALGSAIDMLEHARSLTSADRWHTIGIDRQLIGVLSLAGRVDRLREIGESASAFIDEKRRVLPGITLARGEIHLLIARAMAAAAEEADVEEHLAQARDYLEQTGEQRVWAGLNSFEAQRALVRGNLSEAKSKAAEALVVAEGLRLDETIGEALSVQGTAELLAGEAKTALELFERAREQARRPIQRLRALLDLGSAHAVLDGSTEMLQEVYALAGDSGALEYGVRAELAIAETQIHRFDLAAAATTLGRSLETSHRYRLAQLPETLTLEALRLALAGDRRAAASMVGEATMNAGPSSLTRAVIALLDEDVDGARAALQHVRFGTEAALSGLLTAARGEPMPPIRVSGAVAEGLLAHASAIEAQSADAFTLAEASLVRFPWWRHIARRLSAEAALNAGWGDPAAWLPETLAFFEFASHDPNVQACRALLRRSGAPVPRKGRGDSSVPADLRGRGVTSRETDVLRLLAEGLGNREIAARLFLSHRTVETHVSSLMRKLDAGSRQELIAASGRA